LELGFTAKGMGNMGSMGIMGIMGRMGGMGIFFYPIIPILPIIPTLPHHVFKNLMVNPGLYIRSWCDTILYS